MLFRHIIMFSQADFSGFFSFTCIANYNETLIGILKIIYVNFSKFSLLFFASEWFNE